MAILEIGRVANQTSLYGRNVFVKIGDIMATCIFCGSSGSDISGDKGICRTCSNKLMRELLRTDEWRDASKVIAKAIKPK